MTPEIGMKCLISFLVALLNENNITYFFFCTCEKMAEHIASSDNRMFTESVDPKL